MDRIVAPALLAALMIVFAPATKATEAALPEALRRCAAMSDTAQRLSCFDAIAASLASSVEEGAAAVGRWQVTAGAGGIVAEQRPLEPWDENSIVLQIACRDDRIAVAVGRDEPVMSSSTVFTTVRVDDRLLPSDLWSASRDRLQALYAGDARDFLRQLPGTGRLFVRLEGSRRWRFEGTFQLDGLQEIRQRMLAACNR